MAGQLTIDTLKASSGVLATQNGMTGIAKAWVNFVGTSGAINNSFNVSSVTFTSTGNYTVNFTTAMPNANFSAVAMANGGNNCTTMVGTYTASSIQVVTQVGTNAGFANYAIVSAVAFSS